MMSITYKDDEGNLRIIGRDSLVKHDYTNDSDDDIDDLSLEDLEQLEKLTDTELQDIIDDLELDQDIQEQSSDEEVIIPIGPRKLPPKAIKTPRKKTAKIIKE